MADHQVIINSQVYKLIPLGFCACGCGGETKVSKKTNTKHGYVKGKPSKFIKGHNNSVLRGPNNPHWNHGKIVDIKGYVLSRIPEHPRRHKRGYVFEHILIAEKALGKHLPTGAIVHHANGTKDSGTLVLCQDIAYHLLIHLRMRALAACGHVNWRKCNICKLWDDPKNMYIAPSGNSCYHRKCANDKRSKRNQKDQEA